MLYNYVYKLTIIAIHEYLNMKITNIEQFIEKNFDDKSSKYIVTEDKILNSFLKRLVDLGFSLDAANDGEESHKIASNDRFSMLDVIFSVDESRISLTSNNNEKFTLCIVCGNEDATPIYDHSPLSRELDKLIFTEFAKSVKIHSEELYDLNWVGYNS